MLRAFGFDPAEMRQNAEDFMVGVKTVMEKLEANQLRIEAKLDCIEKLIEHPGETTVITENGENTGVLLTTEKFPREMLEDAAKYSPAIPEANLK